MSSEMNTESRTSPRLFNGELIIPKLTVRQLVIVDEQGREVAILGLQGGVARLLLKGNREACAVITPDGLATFDETCKPVVEMYTAYGFPGEIEQEITQTVEPLTA